MSEHEETARDWLDLQERLFTTPIDAAIGRFRSSLVFRGVADAAHASLSTGLIRLGGDPAEKERHLLRNFRKYAYLNISPSPSVWYWLALGQHHGLPTRLLDWTFSPYVAMHFATANLGRMDVDGLIWCVDVDATMAFLPPRLSRLLEGEGAHVFTTELLETAVPDLDDLDNLPGECVLFFEPPSLDDRIVNQFALFSLMSSPAVRLDEWLRGHEATYRRIIIPAALKWEIRDKLDQANMTERMLFPGLDGLSAWLQRYYFTRTVDPAAGASGDGDAFEHEALRLS